MKIKKKIPTQMIVLKCDKGGEHEIYIGGNVLITPFKCTGKCGKASREK